MSIHNFVMKTEEMVLLSLEAPYCLFLDNHCQYLLATVKSDCSLHKSKARSSASGPPVTHLAVEFGVLVEGVVELQWTLLQSHRED